MTTQFDPRLHAPSNLMLVGPSKSGKTTFACRVIRERAALFRGPPLQKVLVCYGEWQPAYDALKREPGVTLHEGLPNDFYATFDGEPGLLVLDDLMVEGTGSPRVEALITRGGHHRCVTTVFLTQNLFRKGARTQTLNTHYVVLFKNPRDKVQTGVLFRQAFPGQQKAVEEAFDRATSRRPYGYLLLDFESQTPDALRLRTDIFPTDPGPQVVYQLKGA